MLTAAQELATRPMFVTFWPGIAYVLTAKRGQPGFVCTRLDRVMEQVPR